MRSNKLKLLVVDNSPELKFAVEFAAEEACGYEFHTAASLAEARERLASNIYFGVLTTLLLPTQELPRLVVEVLRSECRRIVIVSSNDEERAGIDKRMWVECKKELIRQRLARVAREEALIERTYAMQDGTCYWSPSQQRLYKFENRCLERDDAGFAMKCADVSTDGEELPEDCASFVAWFGVMMEAADLFPGTPHFGDYEMREAARAQY